MKERERKKTDDAIHSLNDFDIRTNGLLKLY